VILAEHWSPTNRYVQKVWLNDLPLDRSWLKHSEIEPGGVLRFEMSAEPRKR
jgi:putative alpha-1,2-mannosidase